MVFDTVFSDAVCAGSIAGFGTLDTAGIESIAVLLVCGAINTASTWSMSSTSTERPNTASTGSMMRSTEPRVQKAVPAVQTSEMVGGVLKSIKSCLLYTSPSPRD